MGSVWQDGKLIPEYPAVAGDLETEVLVIGGGMAGVLCARKLFDAGKRVILVEAERLGQGITAKTTAVLTAQHDFLYQDMAAQFDRGTARAYLRANLEAVEQFRELSRHIACDFEDMPSVQFTASEPKRLRREARFLNELGFPAVFQTYAPLPVPAAGAVVYPHMGQFHPLKFLAGAAKGLKVFEKSRVLKLKGNTAVLSKGSIRFERAVVATHFPFIDRRGWYFMKLYQSRSYVLALENAPDPGASMAELDGQGLYFRRYGELLLLGGGDHRTGRKSDGFDFLREVAQRYFPNAREKYAWANQDCMSLDGLPYVGRYSPNMPNVYVATGFNAWGMTNSMVAAELIKDLICGGENALADVLRPDRSVLHRQLLCNIGATVADFAVPTVKRCPHLGCALRWNPQEHSWDCPCHGSRFSRDGELLDTPAQKDAQV